MYISIVDVYLSLSSAAFDASSNFPDAVVNRSSAFIISSSNRLIFLVKLWISCSC